MLMVLAFYYLLFYVVFVLVDCAYKLGKVALWCGLDLVLWVDCFSFVGVGCIGCLN